MTLKTGLARAILAACMITNATAQDWLRELEPRNLAEQDLFGSSVAATTGTVLVGSPRFDQASQLQDSGAAYLFEGSSGSYTLSAMLVPDDPAPLGKFGHAVDVHESRAIVTAPDALNQQVPSGAAYLYERSGAAWGAAQRVTPPLPLPGDGFGVSAAIHGSWAAVGADLDSTVAFNAGAVHLFRRDASLSWVHHTKLIVQQGDANDFFGRSLDLQGGRLVVGAPGDDDANLNAGAAYVFELERGVWVERQKLSFVDTAPHANVGDAIALDGERFVVGATFDDTYRLDPGHVDLIEKRGDAFVHVLRLEPGGLSPRDEFGTSVSILGDEIAVGAPGSDLFASNGGATWLYSRVGEGWIEWSPVGAPSVDVNERSGFALALDEGRAWIAGVQDSDRVALGGSVQGWALEGLPEHRMYCFGVGCPCGNDDAEGGCQNTTGRGARLSPSGSLGVVQDDLVLVVEGAPARQPLALVWSSGGAPSMFGDGLRCGTAGLLMGAPVLTSAEGTHVFGPGLAAGAGFSPLGGVVHLQAWYRDPHGSPCSGHFNLSNALALEFTP